MLIWANLNHKHHIWKMTKAEQEAVRLWAEANEIIRRNKVLNNAEMFVLCFQQSFSSSGQNMTAWLGPYLANPLCHHGSWSRVKLPLTEDNQAGECRISQNIITGETRTEIWRQCLCDQAAGTERNGPAEVSRHKSAENRHGCQKFWRRIKQRIKYK